MSFICGQNEKSLCARVENRVFYENTEKSARGWRTQLFKTPEFRALLRNRAQELVDKMKKTGRINVRPQSGRCSPPAAPTFWWTAAMTATRWNTSTRSWIRTWKRLIRHRARLITACRCCSGFHGTSAQRSAPQKRCIRPHSTQILPPGDVFSPGFAVCSEHLQRRRHSK